MTEKNENTLQTLGLTLHIMALTSPVIGYFFSNYIMNKMLMVLAIIFIIQLSINGMFLFVKNIESIRYSNNNKSFYCSGNDEEPLEDSDTEQTKKPIIIKTFIRFPVTGCLIIIVLVVMILILFTFVNYIIIDNNNKSDKLDIYERKLGIFNIMETLQLREYMYGLGIYFQYFTDRTVIPETLLKDSYIKGWGNMGLNITYLKNLTSMEDIKNLLNKTTLKNYFEWNNATKYDSISYIVITFWETLSSILQHDKLLNEFVNNKTCNY
jgi:NADH:ubiquinone oxidoreductase subunit 3 (subunit A)